MTNNGTELSLTHTQQTYIHTYTHTYHTQLQHNNNYDDDIFKKMKSDTQWNGCCQMGVATQPLLGIYGWWKYNHHHFLKWWNLCHLQTPVTIHPPPHSHLPLFLLLCTLERAKCHLIDYREALNLQPLVLGHNVGIISPIKGYAIVEVKYSIL